MVSRQDSGNVSYNAYATSTYEAYGRRGGDFSAGNGTSPATQQLPARFGGQYGYYTDYSTGLLCLTHRYYDPGTGKFINRDPIGYAGGANLYGFADGNPVNESDPSGFYDFKIGPSDYPWLEFDNNAVNSGLAVGTAATASSFSFGLYRGGKYRNDPSFETSRNFANVGRDILVGVATGGASRLTAVATVDRLFARAFAKQSTEVLEATLSGKNKVLAQLWSTGSKGAEAGLQNIQRAKTFKLPEGVTRDTLLAYKELIRRNIAERTLLKGSLPANDVGLLRIKLIDLALKKSIFH